MSELDAIRERSAKAMVEVSRIPTKHDPHFPIRASARDVPALLEVIDQVRPLVVAARGFIQNSEDTSALERLVEECDQFPWKVLDTLGITEDDEN